MMSINYKGMTSSEPAPPAVSPFVIHKKVLTSAGTGNGTYQGTRYRTYVKTTSKNYNKENRKHYFAGSKTLSYAFDAAPL